MTPSSSSSSWEKAARGSLHDRLEQTPERRHFTRSVTSGWSKCRRPSQAGRTGRLPHPYGKAVIVAHGLLAIKPKCEDVKSGASLLLGLQPSSFLLLVAMPFVPSSFLLLVRPGATSSFQVRV